MHHLLSYLLSNPPPVSLPAAASHQGTFNDVVVGPNLIFVHGLVKFVGVLDGPLL